MVRRVETVRGQEMLVLGSKILLSGKGGIVLRNAVLDRVESRIVSRELGMLPSKFDEVSRESFFVNGVRLLSNLK